MNRIYSYGDQTYKLAKTDRYWRVYRWDPLTVAWQLVDRAQSKRQGRQSAARDAYRRGVNP